MPRANSVMVLQLLVGELEYTKPNLPSCLVAWEAVKRSLRVPHSSVATYNAGVTRHNAARNGVQQTLLSLRLLFHSNNNRSSSFTLRYIISSFPLRTLNWNKGFSKAARGRSYERHKYKVQSTPRSNAQQCTPEVTSRLINAFIYIPRIFCLTRNWLIQWLAVLSHMIIAR